MYLLLYICLIVMFVFLYIKTFELFNGKKV